MSSYYITAANDGVGNFTPTVRRGGTAASAGTALTIPSGELFPGTSTKLLGLAIDSAFRAAINDFANAGTNSNSYSINIVDDGTGNFTPTARRNAVVASGGTLLTIPTGELFPGTTTKLTGLAVGAPKRAALNDRAAGN